MRMIDKDALWEIFREKQNSLTARCGGYRFLDSEDRAEYDRLEITLAYIENAPEVDAVPVVRGEWNAAIGYDPNKKVQCQNCYKMAYEPTPYCPNCGARMYVERGNNDA